MPIPKTIDNKEFGQFLRKRRETLGLTQAQIAQRITEQGYNCSGGTVSRWEDTGAVPPLKEPKYAVHIAKAYKLTVGQLYHESDLAPFQTFQSYASIDVPPELLDVLAEATPEQIRLIVRLAQQVIMPDDE